MTDVDTSNIGFFSEGINGFTSLWQMGNSSFILSILVMFSVIFLLIGFIALIVHLIRKGVNG